MREPAVSTDETTKYGETWVFESIVGAIPGIALADRTTLVLQFLVFEALVVIVAGVFDRWQAVLPGTAAIVVATAGSAVMLDIGHRVRAADVPETYKRLLFATSLEVVLGVVGFAAILTVLFVYQPRYGPTLLEVFLGPKIPLVAAFLFFMVLWDIAYRIGTAWWIAVLALWRAFAVEVDAALAADFRAIDHRTAAFGLVQLTLLPFLWEYRLLAAGLLGHVLAVLLVVAGARMKTSATRI